MDKETFWPPNFAELDLEKGKGMRPEDIADYAYPPGKRGRYTELGWQKACALGIAILDVKEFGGVSDNGSAEH